MIEPQIPMARRQMKFPLNMNALSVSAIAETRAASTHPSHPVFLLVRAESSSPLARVSFPACISHQPAPWQMLFNSGNVVQQQRVLQSAEPAAFKRRFSPKMIHRYVDTEIAPPFVTPTGERGRGELSPEGSCRHWLLQCLSLCV